MHTWIIKMINLLNLWNVIHMFYIIIFYALNNGRAFYQIDKTCFICSFIYLFTYSFICLFICGSIGCLSLHSSSTHFRRSLLRTECIPLSCLTTLKMVHSGLLQLVCKYYILFVAESRNFKRL